MLLAIVTIHSLKKTFPIKTSVKRYRKQTMHSTPLLLCFLLSHTRVPCLSEHLYNHIYFKRIGFIVYLKEIPKHIQVPMEIGNTTLNLLSLVMKYAPILRQKMFMENYLDIIFPLWWLF